VFDAFEPKSLQFLPTTVQEHFTLLQGPFHSFHATFCPRNFTANVAEGLQTIQDNINLIPGKWNDVIIDIIIIWMTYTKDSVKWRLMLRQEIIQLQVRLPEILLQLWLFPIPVISGGGRRQSFNYSHQYARVFSYFVAPGRLRRTRSFHLELNRSSQQVDLKYTKNNK